MKGVILETAEKYIPKKIKVKTTPWLSKEAITIAADRREAKREGDKDKVRELNSAFQKQAHMDIGQGKTSKRHVQGIRGRRERREN